MFGIESPYVELIDARRPIEEMHGRIAAKGDAHHALAVQDGPFPMASEKILAIIVRYAREAPEIGLGDGFEGTVGCHGFANRDG